MKHYSAIVYNEAYFIFYPKSNPLAYYKEIETLSYLHGLNALTEVAFVSISVLVSVMSSWWLCSACVSLFSWAVVVFNASDSKDSLVSIVAISSVIRDSFSSNCSWSCFISFFCTRSLSSCSPSLICKSPTCWLFSFCSLSTKSNIYWCNYNFPRSTGWPRNKSKGVAG